MIRYRIVGVILILTIIMLSMLIINTLDKVNIVTRTVTQNVQKNSVNINDSLPTSTSLTLSNTSVKTLALPNNSFAKPYVIQSIPESTFKYYRNTVMFEEDPMHIYFVPVKSGYFILNVTGAIIVPPSIYGDLIIVTTSGPMDLTTRTLMYDIGCIYAVNLSNGNVVWSEEFQNQIMTQPIIINGILIVGLGNNQFINCTVRGTGENAIEAINISNGRILWNFTTLGEDMPTPVYYNGMIIEANGNGEVFALNISNGELVWSDNIQSYVSMSSPVLANNVIYFGSAHPYVFWAINAQNGKILWYDNLSEVFNNSALGGLDDSSPAYSNGIVVTSFTIHLNSNFSMYEILIAMNSSNGKILWTLNEGNAPIPPNLESPPPVIYRGIVFHDSPVGILYAVNLTNGKILWTFKTGPTLSNVDIVRNLILIQNSHGTLYILNLKGELIKQIITPVQPGPGNIIVTLNSIILVGINGVIDTIPLQSIFE
ncbi:PQQ-binding-like beta-propeller repeat protein [Sulfolobus tengchongensis]|uniref:PQQ-binding-like beta-propeller repeat protein n=1 Tax=Sulfolobus tengchongensis TaxID=207809 RepID=A0AAX4L0X4_9CREN